MLTWDESVITIPPGAEVFAWGTSIISEGIRAYQKWETGKSDTPTHDMQYFGSGKRECVSAEIFGVKKISLDSYKKNRLEIYSYRSMTVQQLQILKSYSYGTVGRLYDYPGLFSFLGNLIKKKLPQWKFANFCSELVAESQAYEGVNIEVLPGVLPEKQTPAARWLKIVQDPIHWKPELYWNIDKK